MGHGRPHKYDAEMNWLLTEGRGILFLDELPQASLSFLSTRCNRQSKGYRIGEHRLPPTWMVT